MPRSFYKQKPSVSICSKTHRLTMVAIAAIAMLGCSETDGSEEEGRKPEPPDAAIFAKPPTPFIGITAIDDPMSDFEEPNASSRGAMEMQRFFSTTVVASLDDCLESINQVFVDWYSQHKLIPSQAIRKDDKLQLRIWDKSLQGIFEGGYQFNKQPAYIRASLDYFTLDGKKLPLVAIKSMIGDYKLNQLTTDLRGAMECEQQ